MKFIQILLAHLHVTIVSFGTAFSLSVSYFMPTLTSAFKSVSANHHPSDCCCCYNSIFILGTCLLLCYFYCDLDFGISFPSLSLIHFFLIVIIVYLPLSFSVILTSVCVCVCVCVCLSLSLSLLFSITNLTDNIDIGQHLYNDLKTNRKYLTKFTNFSLENSAFN